ncbi:hypothetical protein D1007_26620 [Hordeum vulgare]|uniref:Predicted protein n=1 Tax=Hordeum vulgare subsp. vulgare TaxID=112509 RepID=F2DWC7_HORVV|nr:uncharacterized protein LOC123439578 [Hordeum vulgare subsp. vulgare]KAE8798150.1 hypothetical protein D1007_26620 [Hordeum vulgare]KAI5005611.1 hypothetical protein ZWY2020_032854 [Hordeum vulgare]KAI5005612.1 hypothetical protein ZWY2020_032855 [Hordeum vulgare]BAJ99398.1 predicted protein [Hordeum vulgare subsp. vulgare]BAK04056.1 predicted protein [Hordeum vulgare subsp. vulgare]
MDEGKYQQGWLSVGLPPAPVLAVTGIVTFFLYLSWQMDEYEEQLRHRTQAGFWVLLVLGVLALVFLAQHALFDGEGRVVAVPAAWRGQPDGGSGTSPWGVAALVALLLVLVSHRSDFQIFKPPGFR